MKIWNQEGPSGQAESTLKELKAGSGQMKSWSCSRFQSHAEPLRWRSLMLVRSLFSPYLNFSQFPGTTGINYIWEKEQIQVIILPGKIVQVCFAISSPPSQWIWLPSVNSNIAYKFEKSRKYFHDEKLRFQQTVINTKFNDLFFIFLCIFSYYVL